MKKILAFFVVAAFLLGGIQTIGVNETDDTRLDDPVRTAQTATATATFSAPDVSVQDGYTAVHMDGCGMTASQGKPVLPVWRTTVTLPFGASIKNVAVETGDVQEALLHQPVKPARQAVPPNMETVTPAREPDPAVYDSAAPYPVSWYDYEVASGIRNGQRVTTVTVSVYPARYSPASDTLRFCRQVDVEVDYTPPSEPLVQKDEYDLLVVCPRAWEASLDPLVEHKQSHGIDTKVACMECIKAGEYFPPEGRDDAEILKQFIKNAVEEWGIEYVLLVGGRKPGIRETWHVPVRYVHVFWADENRYMTDLYYADIYNGTGSFSTWDTDDNDVFYEWARIGELKDQADLTPDVYLGRWACRTRAEVSIMVDKTITYENSQGTRNVVLAGGDNFPALGVEGEIVCDKVLDYLPGYDSDKIYVTTGDVTSDAMKQGMNDGAMFIHMHGHGSPIYWSTHAENDTGGEWEDGFKFYDIPFFFNDEYSIAIIGGCHTAMFNISMTNYPWAGTPCPQGSAWWFARKLGGGAIASFGYTAFPVATPGEDGDLDGDGVNDPDCAESGYGYMQLELFNGYSQGNEYLGECWSHAVSNYTAHYKTPAQRWHLHTIQSFVLLGDPSLKIGGY